MDDSRGLALPTDDESLPVGRVDHHCFGCGRLNPHGLHLVFTATDGDDGVSAIFTPNRTHEGFTGITHGGIISSVLDEAMGWAVSVRDIWAVTARMEVSFRHPLAVGTVTNISGRIVADRGRLLDLAAEVRRVSDDRVMATATATFARVPETQARDWRARYLDRHDGE